MIIKNSISLNKPLLLTTLLISINIPVYANSQSNLLYDGFTVSYDVYKDDFHLGISKRKLTKLSGNQYQYTSFTYAEGVVRWFVKDEITETSHYKLINNVITPSRYDSRNSNGKPKDNFSIIFNNKENTVTRTKDNITHNIANNKQDLLSFQVAIMLAMQEKNKKIIFTIVDNKRITEYSLKHTKDENLETEQGEINTRVMESSSSRNKYHFIFWCAKKYDYFPVIVKRIKKNGDELLMKIKSINGKKITFIVPSEEDY